VRVQRGWDYLHRLKHNQHLPKPQHALADPDERTVLHASAFRFFGGVPGRLVL
jgi:hypothetical protein